MTDRQADKHTDRQSNRQTDNQTDRQVVEKTDKMKDDNINVCGQSCELTKKWQIKIEI